MAYVLKTKFLLLSLLAMHSAMTSCKQDVNVFDCEEGRKEVECAELTPAEQAKSALDANEFTSQLVQFASVEQQIYQNSNLEKMLNLQETSQISEMVDFIGNRVEFFGQKLPLENGVGEFSYVMPAGVTEATVNIANSNGINVFFADADTNQGKHTINWDGKDKNGRQLPDGEYTVLVSGRDGQGNLMQVEHLMTGSVNGAGVDDGKVKLFIGDSIIIEQDKILSVHKPNTKSASEEE